MLTAQYQKYDLNFIVPGVTSRGTMHYRTSWFITISDGNYKGIGECAPLPGLSRDVSSQMDDLLQWVCLHINDEEILNTPKLWNFPSIIFGMETALLDLKFQGRRILFENNFSQGKSGIPINGLIWMGSLDYMRQQVKQRLSEFFDCIKIKISASGIEDELSVIREIRKQYGWNIEIRVDANGAFNPENCNAVLDRLAALKIHSIEQPIPSGMLMETKLLCKNSPIPIALDEDIIHWPTRHNKNEFLDFVQPQYIILKPGLTGGFKETTEWITLAEARNIGWWITSALESNIGLNAIAQYTAGCNTSLKQGLGTGKVFSNNFGSPLYTENGFLRYRPETSWDLKYFYS